MLMFKSYLSADLLVVRAGSPVLPRPWDSARGSIVVRLSSLAMYFAIPLDFRTLKTLALLCDVGAPTLGPHTCANCFPLQHQVRYKRSLSTISEFLFFACIATFVPH